MNAKEFAIAHGEKFALGIIVLLCGWMVFSSLTDKAIRPQNATPEKFNQMSEDIFRVLQDHTTPRLLAPPDFLDIMKARFATPLAPIATVPWLYTHPDIQASTKANYFYIYEIQQPTVKATDNIGKVILELTLPSSDTVSSEHRLSTAYTQDWHRDVERTIVNHAEIFAVELQMRVGEGPWRPVHGPNIKDGLMSIADARKAGKMTLEAGGVWERHHFRARFLAKATGYTFNKVDTNPDQSVLVVKGTVDEPDWKGLQDQERHDAVAFAAHYDHGTTDNLPNGTTLAEGERFYTGDWSDESSVTITADIRFAFVKVVAGDTAGAADEAEFLVTKQFLQTSGSYLWMEKPHQFKVDINGPVGDKVVDFIPGDNSGNKNEIDLTTPFVLTDIKKDVVRTLYYEIDAKPRKDPGKDKDLEVKTKTVPVDVAVLKNTNTGAPLEVPRLLTSVKRPGRPNAIYYPIIPDDPLNEVQKFTDSPADFVQFPLTPTAPILHHPDEGPLEDLRKSTGDNLMKTDTDYYEMPDGRVVWWENLNHKLRVYPPQAEEAPKAAPTPPSEPPPHNPTSHNPTPHTPPQAYPGPNGPGGQQSPPGTPGGPGGPPGGPGGYPGQNPGVPGAPPGVPGQHP